MKSDLVSTTVPDETYCPDPGLHHQVRLDHESQVHHKARASSLLNSSHYTVVSTRDSYLRSIIY
jgi:hypothetical protein